MKKQLAAVILSLAIPTFIAPTPTTAQAVAQKPRFTAKAKLGELMDNPATMAILQRHIPDVMADPEIKKGRGYSLRFISGFDKRIKTALPAIERDLATVQ